MTRDELLKEIDFELGLSDYDTWREGAKALRAVVELHKPVEYEFNGQPVLVCNHCQLGVVGDEYPCETIQAIEKELK